MEDPMIYCNSISPSKIHSCEREKDHLGRCQAESFRGGYVFWPKPKSEEEE